MIDVNKLVRIADFNTESYNRAINEATFYGRNKILSDTELLLNEMVEIGHSGKSGGTSGEEFTNRMYQVAENIRKAFGFYSVQINNSCFMLLPPLFYAFSTSAGCTLCHTAIIKYSKKVINGRTTYMVDFDKNHKGIKFKPNSRYSLRMFISPTSFMDNGENSLTGAEILAIMLHEIGHNFYVGPIRELTAEFLGALTTADLMEWIADEISGTLLLEGASYIDSNILTGDARRAVMRIDHIVGSIVGPADSMSNIIVIAKRLMEFGFVIGNAIERVLTSPIRAVRAVLKYDAEKYSDSFAVAYGYGAELNSALFKITRLTVPVISTIKPAQEAFDFIYGAFAIPVRMFTCILDPHPNEIARLNNNIKYMEAAGASITNPRLKKEYERELQHLYDVKDQVLAYRGTNIIKLNYKVRAIIADFTKISDIKDLTSSLKPLRSKYANLDYAD